MAKIVMTLERVHTYRKSVECEEHESGAQPMVHTTIVQEDVKGERAGEVTKRDKPEHRHFFMREVDQRVADYRSEDNQVHLSMELNDGEEAAQELSITIS
jgi:hypothetical protein